MGRLRAGRHVIGWFPARFTFDYTWILNSTKQNRYPQSLGAAGRHVLPAHSLCICFFPFDYSWKPEDFDGMPGQQTGYCWASHIRQSCSAARMPGAAAFVLTDTIWKTFGHWQLKCARVSFFTVDEEKIVKLFTIQIQLDEFWWVFVQNLQSLWKLL